MRKLVFAALAGVFMLSSGFAISNENVANESEFFSCNCACNETVMVGYPIPMAVTFRTYVNGAQACDAFSGGYGEYDSSDCQNSAGVLNAKSVEELHEAESGC